VHLRFSHTEVAVSSTRATRNLDRNCCSTSAQPKKAGRKAGSVNNLADTLAEMNLVPRSSADPISTPSHGLTVIKGGAVVQNSLLITF
jgi:hypothetical protein